MRNEAPTQRTRRYSSTEREPNRRAIVLVVDDNSSIRRLVRLVLEDSGHTVMEAKDGLDGLDTFRRDPFRIQVVVMDIDMPRMNGIDAFRAMRAIRNDLPVIVASGRSVDEYRDCLPVADLAGFLRKPFALDDLLNAVDRCVPLEGNQNASQEPL